MASPNTVSSLLVFAALLSWCYAQNSVVVRSPCLYNSTHCSCYTLKTPGKCLRHQSGDSCVIDNCSSAGLTCDCSGTDLCQITSCRSWIPSLNTSTDALKLGEVVSCKLSNLSGTCLKKVEEKGVPPITQEPKEYRSVQLGRASANTMFNLTAFLDEGNFITKTYSMHGKWKSIETLRRRYLNLRIYKSDGIPGHMLCAVYNKHDLVQDGMGNMRVEVNISGVLGQELQWAACDDNTECHGNNEATLIGRHTLLSPYADGWCIKPLESNGNAITVKFTRVDGMKGVVLQSATGSDKEFLFGDEAANGMKGNMNKYGLVQNGEVPEILFNLQGIAVPFKEVRI